MKITTDIFLSLFPEIPEWKKQKIRNLINSLEEMKLDKIVLPDFEEKHINSDDGINFSCYFIDDHIHF